MPELQTTSLATSTRDDVFVRDRSLCKELIGKLTFTEMMLFQLLGRMPTPPQTRAIDACLVTLMEHGLTPSALAARLVYTSAPEAMQAAVAGGLLAVGSLFVGTMDGCGQLLKRIVESEQADHVEAIRIAEEHRAAKKPLPGFGHPIHKPDDPRSSCLLNLAKNENIAGRHVQAIEVLSRAVDQVYQKHITVNATGAIAAVLGDCGIPYEIMRGFAIVARCAGLVGHVHEEQHKPAMRVIWETADRAVKYDGKAGLEGAG